MDLRATAVGVVALAGAGCHGCRDNHPYVPYAIGSAEPGSDSAGAQAAAVVPNGAADAGAPARDVFASAPATEAPPGVAHWPVQGVVLDAPAGHVFVSAIVQDFEGTGARQAFALVRPAEGNDPGRVIYARAGAPGATLAEVQTFAPPPGSARDASCTPLARLAGAGGHSVLVELGVQCPHAPSAPPRWVAVLDGGAQVRLRFAATIADPPGAASLSVDAAVADRDGDGREDLALRVALEGGGPPLEPGPRVWATFAWLDRPAGLSRDQATTEASFASLASQAASRASRAKEAPAVPGYVAQARALWRAVCADGGSPRLVPVAGTGAIACASARPLEELGLAEVRALATLGDPLRAALALDRNERAPAARTPSRLADAQRWIEKLAPASNARLVRAIAAVPLGPHGREPAWGDLAFEGSGKLLVRTRAGMVRVDPDQGDEAGAETAAWPTRVVSPDGAARWIEAYDPCDGTPLRATFELGSGQDARDLALPVPAPLGGRCAGSRGAPVHAVPIAWGPSGLEALVEGSLVLVSPDLVRASPLATFLDQPWAAGSPRSPDDKALVVPTIAGLLVRGQGRARLLRAPELDGTYGDQRDCVVSNDMTHVGCVRAGRAWVGAWDSP